MPTDLELIPGTLPSGFCPTNFQEINQAIITRAVARFPSGLNTFNYGNTEPSPEDRDKPWLRTKANGEPDRWYVFWNGVWVSRHPIPANDQRIVMWEGSEADIAGIDLATNNSGSVTDTTGPFWEKVAAFDGRMPIGPGSLPSGSTVGLDQQGGTDEVTLTKEQMPSHDHEIEYKGSEPSEDTGGNPGEGIFQDDSQVRIKRRAIISIEGNDQPHTNMPPYRGIFFIRRTGRKYYTPSDAP